MVKNYRYTPWIKELYDLCKQKIERLFADAKIKHGLRYTQLRGLSKETMQVTLTFACMNLKKLAEEEILFSICFCRSFTRIFLKIFFLDKKSVLASGYPLA